MIDFLIEHYEFIIWIAYTIASFIISLVVLIVAVNKKDSSVKEFILENLPGLISTAESLYTIGAQKKDFVLKTMNDLIKNHFPKVLSGIYRTFISKRIESILSTPEKKND